MKHDIQLTFDNATETYLGTIDGLVCTSTPDKISITFPAPVGVRSLSWNTKHLKGTNGDVCRALIYLWGVYHKRG